MSPYWKSYDEKRFCSFWFLCRKNKKIIIQTYDSDGTNKSAISKTNRNRKCQELYSIGCEANQIGDPSIFALYKSLS